MSNVPDPSGSSGGSRWFSQQPLSSLRHEIDNLLERFASGKSLPHWLGESGPPTDLCETDAAIHVHMDLPGWIREEIQVELQGMTLTVKGIRTEESGGNCGIPGAKGLRTERRREPFARSFLLPCPTDETQCEAILRDGILRITLPKSPQARSHQIPITKVRQAPPEPAAG